MATLAEVETRVRDLDLRVRAIEQAQADNLSLHRALLDRVDAGFAAIRGEMSTLRGDMDAGFASVRAELDVGLASVRDETGALRADMDAGFAVVRADIAEIKDLLQGGRG